MNGPAISSAGDMWIAELENLQAQAPLLDFEALRPPIEEDLRGPLDQIFAHVDATPLAAASVAAGSPRDTEGRQVVLKIQRPGIGPPSSPTCAC